MPASSPTSPDTAFLAGGAGAPTRSSGGPRPGPAVLADVRDSCLAVTDRPVRLAESFYWHLFDIAPRTRDMFPANMSDQMQKMIDVLLAAVAGLDDADTTELEASLRSLGAHHRRYLNVEPAHYGYIGHALTRAVRDVSGPRWSGALSSSWIAVTQWMTTQMLSGADTVDP